MPIKGNLLINYGGLSEDENEYLNVGIHKCSGTRIVKETRKEPAEEAFELIISFYRTGV